MKQEKFRPPIVAVLGHVDHGKTTLLDKIRQTRVQEKEAGGITQSIGASVITTKSDREITFIDTPGHSAFSNMRSQGVNACDVAVLVVASDDGVKPQTKEAIELIKNAKIPYLVALTKSDLPSSNSQSAMDQLSNEGVMLDGRGGDVACVEVSAKENQGLDELLETILLISDLNGIKCCDDLPLKAVVIETAKTNAGITASIVVKDGVLRENSEVSDGVSCIKIKGLFDANSKRTSIIKSGYPGVILGFSMYPKVGSIISSDTKSISEIKQNTIKGKIKDNQHPFILKALSTCSLEAVINGIRPEVYLVDSSIGDVSESDVLNAKSSNARIFTFESRASKDVRKLADAEGVVIESFDIIYKLFERIDELIDKKDEEVLGMAEIIALFEYEGKRVAGCKVVSGSIERINPIFIKRDTSELGKAKILSMKKQKQDISKVGTGEEFGAIIEPMLDFKQGDVIVSVKINKLKDSLRL